MATLRRSPVTTAAILWMSGAAVYLTAETVAAAAFPAYSYAGNYISDLGVPQVGEFDGRVIDSPLHVVMNAGFILQGVLFLCAAIALVRGTAWGPRRSFVVFAAAFAVGIILVGIVPGSQQSAQNGVAGLHVLGAALAIVGGNLTALTAGSAAQRRHAGLRRYGVISVALGVLGLIGLVMLQVDSVFLTQVQLLPDGIWERVAVYTVTVWQLLTGVALLVRQRRRRTTGDSRMNGGGVPAAPVVDVRR